MKIGKVVCDKDKEKVARRRRRERMTVNVWTRKQKTKRMILGGRGGVGVVTEAEITRWQFCNSPHTAIDSEHHNHHIAVQPTPSYSGSCNPIITRSAIIAQSPAQCGHVQCTKSRTSWNATGTATVQRVKAMLCRARQYCGGEHQYCAEEGKAVQKQKQGKHVYATLPRPPPTPQAPPSSALC